MSRIAIVALAGCALLSGCIKAVDEAQWNNPLDPSGTAFRSQDTTLSALTLSGNGTWNQAFTSGSLSYEYVVADTIPGIDISAQPKVAARSVRYDLGDGSFGTGSNVALTEGQTRTVRIRVENDQGASLTYVVALTRKVSPNLNFLAESGVQRFQTSVSGDSLGVKEQVYGYHDSLSTQTIQATGGFLQQSVKWGSVPKNGAYAGFVLYLNRGHRHVDFSSIRAVVLTYRTSVSGFKIKFAACSGVLQASTLPKGVVPADDNLSASASIVSDTIELDSLHYLGWMQNSQYAGDTALHWDDIKGKIDRFDIDQLPVYKADGNTIAAGFVNTVLELQRVLLLPRSGSPFPLAVTAPAAP